MYNYVIMLVGFVLLVVKMVLLENIVINVKKKYKKKFILLYFCYIVFFL